MHEMMHDKDDPTHDASTSPVMSMDRVSFRFSVTLFLLQFLFFFYLVFCLVTFEYENSFFINTNTKLTFKNVKQKTLSTHVYRI